MKIGFSGINDGALTQPESIACILRSLEDAGFESVWTGEHLVVGNSPELPSFIQPEFPILDTIATLAFAAAHTSHLKLGSGIILLAQRNPVVLAKELSSIDVLSNGRLIFGVGVGYVKHEFDVIGVPYEERGARVDEYIKAIRALWTEDQPEFSGQFTRISGVQQKPSPMQIPHPPIVIGGMSPAAYHRAIACGDGWFGANLREAEVAKSIESLRVAADKAAMPERYEQLEISVSPRGIVDLERVQQFASLGVSRLILRPPFVKGSHKLLDDALRFIENTAKALELV